MLASAFYTNINQQSFKVCMYYKSTALKVAAKVRVNFQRKWKVSRKLRAVFEAVSFRLHF